MIESLALGLALFVALALVRHLTLRLIHRQGAQQLIREIEQWLATVTPVPSEG
jgi:hypothetical protein